MRYEPKYTKVTKMTNLNIMFAIMITHFAFGSEEQHIKVSVFT